MSFIEKHKSMLTFTLIGILISPLMYFIFMKTVKLTDFDIINFGQNVNNVENFRKLTWSESRHASRYQVVVLNDNLKILKIQETKKPELVLDSIDTSYNQKLIINIKAIDIHRNTKQLSTKDYKLTWNIPSINIKNEADILNNKDLKFDISHDEDEELKNYYFILSKNDNTIYKDIVTDSTGTIPKEIMEMLIGGYEIKLCTKINDIEHVINQKKINIKVPKISNIDITYPNNNEVVNWDDFSIKFDGGNNATKYYISLADSNGEQILDNVQTNEKNLDVLVTKLKENTEYKLEINAINPLDNSVNKNKKISFKTGIKKQANVVESNTPNGNVTWNKLITLSSQTRDAKIFYTTNGTTPTSNSNLYTGPIKINSKVTIKAIAIRNNMYDSRVTEFKYNPVSYGMGSSSSRAPIALYNEGYLPIRYYNQRTSGYADEIYGPANNDWDEGYPATISSHGCGPTALAIVVSTLTEEDVNPSDVTNFACNNGYCYPGGTINSIMLDYPVRHGLKVEKANKLDKQKIINALKSKNSLVVALMGKGSFTTSSHFIVLRGASNDGRVLVADPNSLEKSKRFWSFNTILEQVKEPYFFIISK